MPEYDCTKSFDKTHDWVVLRSLEKVTKELCDCCGEVHEVHRIGVFVECANCRGYKELWDKLTCVHALTPTNPIPAVE